tara:strand:+ start:286 stop:525 length:240 start_codon:yes stop_codon:yes gene_type:complete
LIKDPPGGKDNPTTDISWVETSVLYLDNFIQQNSQFYAILGYSQGCPMALTYISQRPNNNFQKALSSNSNILSNALGKI